MKYIIFIVLIIIVSMISVIPSTGIASDSKDRVEADHTLENKKESISDGKMRHLNEKGNTHKVKSTNKQNVTSNTLLVYKPPLRGAPVGRVGGGTRGKRDALLTLFALVPDHVGFTVEEQPCLFWFLSKKTNYPVELTIIENQAIHPLLEKRINSPVHPGLHRIRLTDYGVHLSPGIQYQWFVSIISDQKHRSKDIVVDGNIEYVKPTRALGEKLSQAGKTEAVYVYAEEGLWYDALTAISDLIDASPNDQELKTLRASLLKQAGLVEIDGLTQ